jgi:hypothetical protein
VLTDLVSTLTFPDKDKLGVIVTDNLVLIKVISFAGEADPRGCKDESFPGAQRKDLYEIVS